MPEPALVDVMTFAATIPIVVSKVVQVVRTVTVAADLAPAVTKVVER